MMISINLKLPVDKSCHAKEGAEHTALIEPHHTKRGNNA